MTLSQRLSAAGRVARTAHQLIVGAVTALPVLVVSFNLPADKAVGVSGALVLAGTLVAKVYNTLFPAEAPLDETL